VASAVRGARGGIVGGQVAGLVYDHGPAPPAFAAMYTGAAMVPDEPDLTDAVRWVEALRAAYVRSLEDGTACWRRAEGAAAAGPVPAKALAKAALLALETMGPGDSISLGMSACEALRRHGGAGELERLRAVRATLPARSGLRDWRAEATRARVVIEARAAGSCTCAAEAACGAGVYDEQWRVESERVDREQYCVHMVVRCTRCQSAWLVRQDDGYHYPTFAWSRA